MRRKELDIAIDWAREEGWNPGLYDAECFWEADPKGFFIGLLDSEPISVVSMVKYGDDYAFGGLYIVKDGYRGNEYGEGILRKAIEYAGERSIGGDGVVEHLPTYLELGAKLAHNNVRYLLESSRQEYDSRVVMYKDALNEKVTEYDTEAFGYDRASFLDLWLTRPGTKVRVYLEGDTVKGYGVIRKCFDGYKVGPLFADSTEIAGGLLKSLIGSVEVGSTVYWDVAEDCPLIPIVRKRMDIEKVFETGRVYLGDEPNFPREKWFGITSFELG